MSDVNSKKEVTLLTLLRKSMLEKIQFLGAFAKLRKATISFVIFVCPSAWNN
jgi:hypothetical protein